MFISLFPLQRVDNMANELEELAILVREAETMSNICDLS